jgi:hypothetical protein
MSGRHTRPVLVDDFVRPVRGTTTSGSSGTGLDARARPGLPSPPAASASAMNADQAIAPAATPVPSAARERAISLLTSAFAADQLDMEEFERRVTITQTTDRLDEIEDVLADLAPPADQAALTVLPATAALLAPTEVMAAGHVVTAGGHSHRLEPWRVPRRLTVVSMVGRTTLDFRVAQLPPGPVEVVVGNVIGKVTLIVPPSLPVEADGLAIIGGFDHVERAPRIAEPGVPLLRIRGFSALGRVIVEMRLPGETAEEASRRRHRQG